VPIFHLILAFDIHQLVPIFRLTLAIATHLHSDASNRCPSTVSKAAGRRLTLTFDIFPTCNHQDGMADGQHKKIEINKKLKV